jgi:hypothetical protein
MPVLWGQGQEALSVGWQIGSGVHYRSANVAVIHATQCGDSQIWGRGVAGVNEGWG